MHQSWKWTLLATAALMAGCASQHAEQKAAAPAAAEQPDSPGGRIVKSMDGSFTGEIDGNPAPGSKFAKIKIGMSYRDVTRLIGAPDDMKRYETGKRWIPFYYGNDAQRVETLYRNEGCLIFTGGNVFGGGGEQLIRVMVDSKGACMAG